MWKYLSHPPHPVARVLLLPFAGGSSASYKSFARHLRGDVELLAYTPPGRGERFRDAPCPDMDRLVERCLGDLPPAPALPYAIFGHSLGSLVGFELALRLADGRPAGGPFHFFASACRAPILAETEPFWPLDDREFLEKVRGMDGIAQEIWDCPEFLDMLLPALRADFRINDTYRFPPPAGRPPLACPITVFGGTGDDRPGPAHLAPWRDLSSGPFRKEMFAGGHFFLLDVPEALAAEVNRDLGAFLGREPASGETAHRVLERQALP